MPIFKIYNGVMPTTGEMLTQLTGTAIKTMLQVKGNAGIPMEVLGWGVSMAGVAAAEGVKWELIETGTVFATLTTLVAADVVAWDSPAIVAGAGTYFSFGTTATGYWSTGGPTEGSIVASRVFDSQKIQQSGQYVWDFHGDKPYISPVSSLRIRCLAATTVAAQCFIRVRV